MPEIRAYQYVYIDQQQMGWNEYHITKKFFSSKDACLKWLHPNSEAKVFFKYVGRFKPSKLTGEYAKAATMHEREDARSK